MGFVSIQFFIFFLIVFAAYWLTASHYRYVVLFVSSCVFYYSAGGASLLSVLLGISLWTYIGGLCIERCKRPAVYRLFWWGNLAFLAFYKIADLLPDTLTWSLGTGATATFTEVMVVNSIALPVGMSFYVFSTCWYLSDVYRKGLAAEHNPVRYGAFATFFPSILSGPIQKGRELLPMIQSGGSATGAGTRESSVEAAAATDDSQYELCRKADASPNVVVRPLRSNDRKAGPAADRVTTLAIHGFELYLWGMAVKLFVSNRLSPAVAYIFDRPGFYSKAYYLPAAMLFALQLYADFAAYSDMAIGIAAMLGYPLRRNFDNPFLSTSLTELWNRWHVSLNEWFLENIYYPLGGSRRGKVRKYLNTMVIFLVSGLWHGQGIHFLFWGAYNGALMLIGQFRSLILRSNERADHMNATAGSAAQSADAVPTSVGHQGRLSSLASFADSVPTSEGRCGRLSSLAASADTSRALVNRRMVGSMVKWLRRLIVFLLFSMTFIYFRAGTMEAGNVMTWGILTIRPSDLAGFYPQQMFGGSTVTMILSLLLTVAFLVIQYLRREENGAAEQNLARWRRMPAAARILILAVILAACIIAACGASATSNSQFVYYEF